MKFSDLWHSGDEIRENFWPPAARLGNFWISLKYQNLSGSLSRNAVTHSLTFTGWRTARALPMVDFVVFLVSQLDTLKYWEQGDFDIVTASGI